MLLLSHSVVSDWFWPHGQQHIRLPCPSLSPEIYANSCLLSWWCHPTISSSVTTFFSCPQSFSALGSFPMSWFLASGSQDTGASASASVLPMNIPGWLSLRLTDLISLQSKGLSRVLSSTTIQNYQFFSIQYSLWSNSYQYMTTGKTTALTVQRGGQILHTLWR